MFLLGARDFRQLRHVFDRSVAKFLRDDQQQAMAHAITQEGNIAIRRVLPPALPAPAQEFLQRGTPKTEQRPHQLANGLSALLESNPRMNGRKPANAGTS